MDKCDLCQTEAEITYSGSQLQWCDYCAVVEQGDYHFSALFNVLERRLKEVSNGE